MKNDPRNYLFENYEKILNHFNPFIFLFENVTGLTTAKFNNKKVIDVIKMRLENYNIINDTYKMILNSCEYGYHKLEKEFFNRNKKRYKLRYKKRFLVTSKKLIIPQIVKIMKKLKKKFVTVRDAISDLPL